MASPMEEDNERVTIASMGDGSFDPYGMNLNLPYMLMNLHWL